MRVNEIFYSLQGEGHYTGAAALFVRFSGCNLRCPFCDTEHEAWKEMSEEEIMSEIAKTAAPIVVFTGGEPALQLTSSLVERVHWLNKRVHVETNGTVALPDNVDWVTLSPKNAFLGDAASPVIGHADEIKVLFDGVHKPEMYPQYGEHVLRYLQPLDCGDARRNSATVTATVEYIKRNPMWRLSLQTHKIINIK